MEPVFNTIVHGKWVLAGEHAVLRGYPALAMPLKQFHLSLKFKPELSGGLIVTPNEVSDVIKALLSDALFEESRLPIGELHLESTIPIGAGLGSSAALSVALARWLSGSLALDTQGVIDLATRLEHRFHGQSSGMDVASVISGEPIVFTKGSKPEHIGITKMPRFTFYDSGRRVPTKQCVSSVESLFDTNRDLAQSLDERMGQATNYAVDGLIRYNNGDVRDGLVFIARAMSISHECFSAWGLVPTEAARVISGVLGDGALAAKLTGAGGGGMVVALWPES
ncbi:MAG: hypothetical protein AABZ06_07070 [Bdellovibrionota bacterium]